MEKFEADILAYTFKHAEINGEMIVQPDFTQDMKNYCALRLQGCFRIVES